MVVSLSGPERFKTGVKSAPQRESMLGCPVHELRSKLRKAGLRPTRQRVALGWLLFAKGARHLTAENLYEEASASRVAISLATVYNTLHQFTEAGLLREVAIDGAKEHHHFLLEDSNVLVDIPPSQVDIARLPDVPEGMEVARIDVIVRLRKKS